MITAIDLFSGAGGMSLGAAMAGVSTVLAVECDRQATATYTLNHPRTNVINADIRKIPISVFDASGEVRILFGGPPCQGFSTSNQKTRNADNQTNWLFLEFLRIAKAWKPEWVIVENVHGLMETGKGFFFEKIICEFKTAGYICSWWTLNASDYGVPQNRRRLFIIGSLHGKKIERPKPNNKNNITVKEAINDLPLLENGANFNCMPYRNNSNSEYARRMRRNLKESTNHFVSLNSKTIIERYKHIPQGGNWENIPPELMQNYADRSRCHTGIYHRLREDFPSVVIGNYRKNMLIHPTQDRGLSVREAARIQSFPDSYEFKGSIGFQQQQVGNAVPPLLAETVFKSVIANF